jgi:hypothetical protein
MKTFVDAERGGTVFLADSALDVARYAGTPATHNHYRTEPDWAGHPGLTSVERTEACFLAPWPEGLDTVRAMADRLRHAVPEPRTIRRRPRWSDEDGEVDCERAIRGDEEYMRQSRRTASAGPSSVAVILQVGGAASRHHTELFWRGAAGAAVCELLEEAGYSCEVWCYQHTHSAAASWAVPRDGWIQWRVKEAGDVLDMDTLAKSVSGWFFRSAILGTIAHIPFKVRRGYGWTKDSSLTSKSWFDYMDVSAGFRRFAIPTVYDFDAAVAGAVALLESLEREVPI